VAILLLLPLKPPIIAVGVFQVLPVNVVCQSLVLATNLIHALSAKKMCRHLLSHNAFEILVPFFLRCSQGVEYDSLSILRKDHNYNPVAHEAQATPSKQYGSQIMKYEKW
jgi:hypothetical protein